MSNPPHTFSQFGTFGSPPGELADSLPASSRFKLPSLHASNSANSMIPLSSPTPTTSTTSQFHDHHYHPASMSATEGMSERAREKSREIKDHPMDGLGLGGVSGGGNDSGSSGDEGGKVKRMKAHNGLMSPPTPAPSPTPGRNGWWGTVGRGDGADSTTSFDPSQLLAAFPSLPPPTRLALLTNLLPMFTTPELLMLSSHIGPRLKRDFLRDLPAELALKVLSFVDSPQTLARATCVSRTWKKLLDDEQTWKEMCERHRHSASQTVHAIPNLPQPIACSPSPTAAGAALLPNASMDVLMSDPVPAPTAVTSAIPSSTNGVTPAFGITGPEMFVPSRVRRDSGLMELDNNQAGPAPIFPAFNPAGPSTGGPNDPNAASSSALPPAPAANYVLGQPATDQLPEGATNGQLPPLPSVVAPGASSISTAQTRKGTFGGSVVAGRSTSVPEPMRLSNVRGGAFGLGDISKKEKEQGFSYKMAFKKAFLTESNWLRGGTLLSSHTSADDGVVTSLAVDANHIIIGMANSKVHIFEAQNGVFLRTLVGHELGVWCLTLISAGGGPEVEEDDMDISSDEEQGPGGGLFDPKVLKAFKDKKKKQTLPGCLPKVNLPKSALKGRTAKRRPGQNRRASFDTQGSEPSQHNFGASSGSGLGSSRESSVSISSGVSALGGSGTLPINFNFGEQPPKIDESPAEGDAGEEAKPHKAKRMEQSDVCGAARGWGQKSPIVAYPTTLTATDVRVWNLDSGFCTHVLHGHTSTIRCLKVVDGRPIAVSGSRDATLKVWDIQKGVLLHTLAGHQHSVRCIEIAGNQVVSGSYDCTCRIWDIDTGECLQVLRGHYHQIYAVAFDGERVATGSLDSTVRIWSAATGECIALLQGHTSLVGQLQLTGDTLVTGGSDGRVISFNLSDYSCRFRLASHDNSCTSLQFDERFIVSGGNDGRVKLWDAITGNFIRELTKPCEAVWRVNFRDDRCVILCKRNGKTILEVLSFIPDEEAVYGGSKRIGS